jgi:hypothetical protein
MVSSFRVVDVVDVDVDVDDFLSCSVDDALRGILEG